VICTTSLFYTLACVPDTPASSLQSRLSILRLLYFWCIPRTSFCGHRRAETECFKRSDASVKNFTQPAYSISCKGGKRVLIVKETLCKNDLNTVKNVPMMCKCYYNCNYSFEQKVRGITFVPTYVLLLIHKTS
jgi:hypothetical protein